MNLFEVITLPFDNFFVWSDHTFIDKARAKRYFNRLEKNLTYNEDAHIVLRGVKIPIPRQQTAYGDEGTSYHFSGTQVNARNWNFDEAGKIINSIRKQVEIATGHNFNFCLVNRYQNGENYIGYHHDAEKDLEKPIIATVSFGATRDFLFQCVKTNSIKSFSLESGSLLMIESPTNKYWKHSVPKRSHVKTPRISLTFRQMKI